jgi:hypothetical protein
MVFGHVSAALGVIRQLCARLAQESTSIGAENDKIRLDEPDSEADNAAADGSPREPRVGLEEDK